MKKIMMLGFLMGTFAFGNEISREAREAFENDYSVQQETQDLKQHLRQVLPGCSVRVVPDVDGHLFAATIERSAQEDLHFRTYLISRNVVCEFTNQFAQRAIKRSVTAKVRVKVQHYPNGNITEQARRVVLVNITNEEDEFHIE